MSESAEFWSALNEMRDRLARQEERSDNRDKQIEKMDDLVAKMDHKLDNLVMMAAQARGAGQIALMFGKWGYGVLAGLIIIALSHMQAIGTFIRHLFRS